MGLIGKNALVVVSLALALLLPGCGSGGEEGATASDGVVTTVPSLTKAEYVKRANALCDEVYAEITRKYEAFYEAEKRTEAELDKKAAEVVTPNLVVLEKRLKALGVPPGQEQKVEKIITALHAGIERAEEDVSTTRGAHGEFAFEKPYKLMWAYGLNKCGLD